MNEEQETPGLWDIAPDEAMQFWTNDIYDQCAGEEDL
jgi:hypothetical protein